MKELTIKETQDRLEKWGLNARWAESIITDRSPQFGNVSIGDSSVKKIYFDEREDHDFICIETEWAYWEISEELYIYVNTRGSNEAELKEEGEEIPRHNWVQMKFLEI